MARDNVLGGICVLEWLDVWWVKIRNLFSPLHRRSLCQAIRSESCPSLKFQDFPTLPPPPPDISPSSPQIIIQGWCIKSAILTWSYIVSRLGSPWPPDPSLLSPSNPLLILRWFHSGSPARRLFDMQSLSAGNVPPYEDVSFLNWVWALLTLDWVRKGHKATTIVTCRAKTGLSASQFSELRPLKERTLQGHWEWKA